MSDPKEQNSNAITQLSLEDLMESESAVLRRLGEEFSQDEGRNMAGHYSSTSGHNSSGTHSSHTSAVKEKVA